MSDKQSAKQAFDSAYPNAGVSTRQVVDAALDAVDQMPYDKNDAVPDKWPKKGAPAKPVNCWTALLLWGYQGGAIDEQWLSIYRDGAAKSADKNGFQAKALGLDQADILQGDTCDVPGATLFVGTPDLPMNHVALSLGGANVVSHGGAGRVKTWVSTIADMRKAYGNVLCKVSRKPYWEIWGQGVR